jgi:hypothetical protein
MMIIPVRFAFLAAILPVITTGLAFNVFNTFQPNPELPTLANAQNGGKFSIKMDIGQKEQTHLFLDGMNVELLQEKAEPSQKVGLPGANGPHPKTSSGGLSVKTIKNPFFVDMYGTQEVRFEKGCWEMVWKKDHYCGSLILGFDVPFGAKRNGAQLPQGPLYLSFPVWTPDGLAQKQAERFDAEKRAKEYLKERDEEMMKMQKESNVFKKALHYRNAAAAVERYDFTGVRYWSNQVPVSDEVIPIANGLLMNTKGNIWNKDKSFLGGKHLLLGSAVLASLEDEDVEKQLKTLKP